MKTSRSATPIAVVGIGCWYPGARNPLQLWEGVLARRREFRLIPDERLPLAEYYDPDPGVPDKTYCAHAAVIDGFEFDWVGKRIPKPTFETTDIVQWLALDVALRAMEDAGYSLDSLPNETTSVVLGNSLTGEQSRTQQMRVRWPFVCKSIRAAAQARRLDPAVTEDLLATVEQYYKSVFPDYTEDLVAGMLANTIAGRVANFMDLHGGGYTVDGACASSLLAITTAADALAAGNADLVFAGGVDVALDTFEMIGFAKVGALSAGQITPFDRRASGFVPGEGCGVVALKRWEDARRDGDRVYAVVRGWGVSSDGRNGISAPSAAGQARAIRRALARAGGQFPVDFVECHGTGTRVGDRVELTALASVYGGEPSGLRTIGVSSVKSVIGHTKAAAGAAGFIKAALAVNRRVLPPTASVTEPNAVFENTAAAMYPITLGEVRPPSDTLRAAVSAFGFGGINTHVVLESGDAPCPALSPAIDERALLASSQQSEVFVLDGASPGDIRRRLADLATAAAGMSIAELVDLSERLTGQIGGGAFRAAFLAGSPQELFQRIEALAEMLAEISPAQAVTAHPSQPVWVGRVRGAPRVGFAFPGQGSQRINAARVLLERFEWARELAGTADRIFSEAGTPGVPEALWRPADRGPDRIADWDAELTQTRLAQPVIALISVLWAEWLDRLNIRPAVVVGHSLGELTAFHAAGVLSAEELFHAVAVRGQVMGAERGEEGTMASLGCSRSRAEAVLDASAGYAVVSNVNTPSQTVISGERQAVRQAVELAALGGISAVMLPVSIAFHCRLVAGAAEAFGAAATLPDTAASLRLDMLSTMEGAQITPGMDVRSHLVRQIAAPVDFVSATERLAQVCDVVLEVGPGRVLSDLIARTTDRGLAAFPVESRAGADHDWNSAVAQAFVRGVDVAWPVFFAGRLVRPFVPVSEKVLVTNYCERPFDIDEEAIAAVPPPAAGASLAALPGISAAALEEYLGRRGRFLAEVIRADLGDAVTSRLVPAGREQLAAAIGPPVRAAAAPVPDVAAPRSAPSAEERLVAMVVDRTGYSADRVSGRSRLVDDLNLDSIKSGELIAALAREFGAAGGVDPASLANATLAEIAAAVHREAVARNGGPVTAPSPVTAPGQVAAPGEVAAVEDAIPAAAAAAGAAPDPAGLLAAAVAERTGYPLASIGGQQRLRDDLNLDSIKASEIIAQVARALDVGSGLDPATLANATIAEAAAAIARLRPAAHAGVAAAAGPADSAGPGDAAPATASAAAPAAVPVVPARSDSGGRRGWVRDFVIDYVEQPAATPARSPSETGWAGAEVLVVAAPGEQPGIAGALCAELAARGAAVHEASYAQAGQDGLATDPRFSHLVAVLPTGTDSSAEAAGRLREAVGRLRSIARAPAGPADRPPTTVAYVQFGGGRFGHDGPAVPFEQCCGYAFGASLHLERPELRVRVIDVPVTADPTRFAPCIADELESPDAFVAAGFDTDLVRRVPRPRPLVRSQWQRRAIRWHADDVVLVTGGAKGITAELALAVAKGLRGRTALVGSTPFTPDDAVTPAGAEIARTMKRFADEGLPVRYYSCDLTDPDAVRATVQRVITECGPIATVIHGAALNHPGPISGADEDAAMAETAPKVLGAINLWEALKYSPPKLFVGISSALELTGMAGNGWYAFSNEALTLLVRQYAAAHPGTAGLTVPFTVWADTGMGHRMGSVAHLAKLGVSPIHTADAASHFIRTLSHDPGADRLAIASRIGVATWRPASPPTAPWRFIERIMFEEPGVEVVARARLSTDRDRYLPDHTFRGSSLLPTVFGLEAMAQAVARVTGRPQLGPVVVEQVRLDRPIVVPPGSDMEIEIRAEVRDNASGPTRVAVSIGTEQSGFAVPHFSATFVLDPPDPVQDMPVPADRAALPVRPLTDLYGTFLFQGPLFRRIESVHELDRALDATGACLFRARCQPHPASVDGLEGEVLLGDPYFNDTLLQSFQLVAAARACLPVRIDRVELHVPGGPARWGRTQVTSFVDGLAAADIHALDEAGRVLIRIVGCGFQQLREPGGERAVPQMPPAELTRSLLADQARRLGIRLPGTGVANLPGLSSQPKDKRHQTELVLVDEAVSQWKGLQK